MSQELAALVDQYYDQRQRRLAAKKEVEAMEEEERAMKQQIIDYLKEQETTAIGGHQAVCTLKRKAKAVVEEWAQVYEYVKANDAWDLMYRRINDAAVKQRLEDGIEVPGVGQIWVDELSVNKVKS